MPSISAEMVERTWKRMAEYPINRVPELIDEMRLEQPVLLGYLMAMDEDIFNKNERETIFYIGLVTWQIMKQSRQILGQVTQKKLLQAENANDVLLKTLSSDTEADYLSATEQMVLNYPEPEVLNYIVDAIMEEDIDNPEEILIREEARGMAFIHLVVALDAMILSLLRK